jgi:TonB family protein
MNARSRSPQDPALPGLALPAASVARLALEEGADRRRFRMAVAAAVALHLVLFALRFPTAAARQFTAAEKPRVFVVQPVRFKAPEPPPPEPIRERQAIRVPIPDPTPDDPEPIRPLTDFEPEILPADIDLIVDFPAPPAIEPEPEAPRPWSPADMTRPIRISGDDPAYTELARRVRTEGVVIVRAVIDREGQVAEVKLVKGLPWGLGEATVEAVREWRFRPATLRGKPIAVFYDLSVHFGLQ